MLRAVEDALAHADHAGYAGGERELPVWKSTALFYGATPVDEVLRWHKEHQSEHPIALRDRAVLEAMRGSFDEARALTAAADASAEALGQTLLVATGVMASWEVETLAGVASAAETHARRSCELLERLGDTGMRSLATGQLAESLYELGRLDESQRWTETAEQLTTADDVGSQMVWRQVRAKVLARRGEHAEAERHARDAVLRAHQTDMLNWEGRALVDLAEVLALAGRREEAAVELDRAIALYERKGNVVAEAMARSRRAELAAPASAAS
jgi:tetratricopeptide (TPR) repeat protein